MPALMEILFIATKAPWPPRDGGRVALRNTLQALTGAGHRCTLVAPLVDPRLDPAGAVRELEGCCTPVLLAAAPRPAASSAARSLVGGRPFTVVRHHLPAVARKVRALLGEQHWDLVHVEQMQAMAQVEAVTGRPPVVLRQQNVESRLWTFAAEYRGPLLAGLMRREAKRLAAWEARVMAEATATVALTHDDADHLRRLAAADTRVETVEVPFAHHLDPGDRPLAGAPAVVLLASGGWRPNVDAVRAFVAGWWPEVVNRVPEARLHVFGIDGGGAVPTVQWHPPPEHSAEAFAADAVVAIPSRHPTGVPIKGLEAWARGLPIIASPEAAVSLDAANGEQLLVAPAPEAFATAVARLADDHDLAAKLVAGGRQRLRERHAPEVVAKKLTHVYESIA
jgi:hypothetical protein